MIECNLQYLYLIHKLYFITFVLVYKVMVHARFSNAQLVLKRRHLSNTHDHLFKS